MNLKRLWDTEGKKMVWAIPTWDPHKKLQVWTNDDWSKLYVYDIAWWREVAQSTVDAETYWPVWKSLDDETVGYYITNVPTDLYNWDSGDEVAYTFKDYDGTVLKTGKVDEGTAPTPPADPTREATAQYTYTFAGWNPTVGKITKKTTYTATYTATVNEYDITIVSDDAEKGTVDVASVEWQPYGTAISTEDNVLTIGEGESAVEVTATAETGYEFSSWGELPATVTWDLTITATFVSSGWNYLEWLSKVDDEHYNECVSILTEWEWTWDMDPEVFKSYTDLLNTSYTISDTAEWVDGSDITITLSENEDPDTMDEFPYVCNASYSGDLSWFDPDAYVATITIQDISWEEAVDLWTLTLNKTGA